MNPNARVTDLWTATMSTVVVILLVASAAANPQREGAVEERPSFEAATIKPAAPEAPRNRVMPTSPNRLYIPSMTLSWLIYTAYGDGGFNTAMRVTGGPDWVNKTAFAVEGVALANAATRWTWITSSLRRGQQIPLRHQNSPDQH